jgi:hypothetical protein
MVRRGDSLDLGGNVAVRKQEPEGGLGRKANIRIDKEQMRELRVSEEIGDAIVAAARHQAVPTPQVEV